MAVDLKSIPGTLGARREYTLGPPTHTYVHTPPYTGANKNHQSTYCYVIGSRRKPESLKKTHTDTNKTWSTFLFSINVRHTVYTVIEDSLPLNDATLFQARTAFLCQTGLSEYRLYNMRNYPNCSIIHNKSFTIKALTNLLLFGFTSVSARSRSWSVSLIVRACALFSTD